MWIKLCFICVFYLLICVLMMWIKRIILVKSLLKILKSIMFGDVLFCEIKIKIIYFNKSLWKVYHGISWHMHLLPVWWVVCGTVYLCGVLPMWRVFFSHWSGCILCESCLCGSFIFGSIRFMSMHIHT